MTFSPQDAIAYGSVPDAYSESGRSPEAPARLAQSYPAAADCDRVFDLLAAVRDIVDARPDGLAPPAWCVERGWDDFLLGIAGEDLAACEERGPARVIPAIAGAPASLLELAREVEAATRVPRLAGSDAAPALRLRGLRPRKERQVAAMLELGRPLASGSRRLVDVGCGSGRFTEIAALAWNRPAVGLEREPERVRAARALALSPQTEYHLVDVEIDLSCIASGDLVLGLHACGDLGDAIVRAAAASRASLLLVACCHQKVRGSWREPLSRRAAARRLAFAREVLGLANLTTRAAGFEWPLAAVLEARVRRHALANLLRDRGADLPLDALRHAGSRRESFAGWPEFARRSLAAWDMPPPSEAELAAHIARAREEVDRMRRLSLPRHMLARLLELTLALDRASYLAEAGLEPALVEVFKSDTSPRNLALSASASSMTLQNPEKSGS